MTDLFSHADDPLRDRLRARGWRKTEWRIGGRPFWERPDGAMVDEDEAFQQLAALEAK